MVTLSQRKVRVLGEGGSWRQDNFILKQGSIQQGGALPLGQNGQQEVIKCQQLHVIVKVKVTTFYNANINIQTRSTRGHKSQKMHSVWVWIYSLGVGVSMGLYFGW